MSSLDLSIWGLRLRLEAPDHFVRYVAVAMAPYVVTDAREPDIRSGLEWIDAPTPRKAEEAFGAIEWERRPDRDVWVAGNRVTWTRIDDFTDLRLRAEWSSGRLELSGRYWFQVGREAGLESLRRWRWRSSMDRLRGRRYSTLLYYLVYYPALWWLSRHRGWHVLHGGAVTTPAGTALLTGMPGCGKSTLAVSWLGDPQARMLSDNLILHDGRRLLACPELLLLDRRSLALAGVEASARMEATGERRVFERDAYRPREVCLEPVEASAIFCVQRGRVSALAELAQVDAFRVIRAGNTMAKEVRRLEIMAEVLDEAAATRRPPAEEDLCRLLELIPAVSTVVGEDETPGELIRRELAPRLGRGHTERT